MNYASAIAAQYQAALEMLRQAISKCPPQLWDNEGNSQRFWQVAHHALFYTHLYLQDNEMAFVPYDKIKVDEPCDPAAVLDYLKFCQQQVGERLAQMDLDAASGFHWLPMNKFELQLYTIRHIQQHVGELMERLGRAGVEVDWIGTKSL